jgi:hypothetical protein
LAAAGWNAERGTIELHLHEHLHVHQGDDIGGDKFGGDLVSGDKVGGDKRPASEGQS